MDANKLIALLTQISIPVVTGKQLSEMWDIDVRTAEAGLQKLGIKPVELCRGKWLVSMRTIQERIEQCHADEKG